MNERMYDFKHAQELAWIAVSAGGVLVLELLVKFDASTITDWQTYAVAAGGGVVRAIAGALLANLGRTGP